jgi:hypothetical protein
MLIKRNIMLMSKVNILIMEMMIDLTIENKKVMREF